ncbi:hypothetical protein [Robiginitalea marina]|uniref:Tripartite tricarboxylate transporter TctB family protein n=1 Tax=Robiginitalea marina TaxID=2954105 RepID=A0ABT1AXR5_9FLAO|nr:hypothetical protein [Robiginitalea marina]MCO5724163.1 hypothetical protein [Robiginitalea marina]
MKVILNTRTKILITTIVAVFVLGILILEHFRGGVISHHLLAKEDMPKISNWWGILIVPLVSWALLTLIQKRHKRSANHQKMVSKQEIYGFIGAFIFGIIITVLFYNAPELPGYLLLMTFVVALFLPIDRPEYYLGFILSMTYGFGGILPVLFGLGLMAVYTIEYRYIRKGLLEGLRS